MDVKTILPAAISVGSIFAKFTGSTIDDKFVALLVANNNDPACVAALQDLVDSTPILPNGALAEMDLSNGELKTAFENSHSIKEWASRHGTPATVPEGAAAASAFNFNDLAQYLPMIISLIQTLGGLFGKGK